MKKVILIPIVFLICIATFSQAKKTIVWKELDSFHEIVVPVFHSAEKGNFHATYDSASLVLDRAQKWQASTIPAGLDSKIYQPLVDRLVIETKAISEAVKAKKSETELKPLLRKAHNTFHEILGKFNQSSH